MTGLATWIYDMMPYASLRVLWKILSTRNTVKTLNLKLKVTEDDLGLTSVHLCLWFSRRRWGVCAVQGCLEALWGPQLRLPRLLQERRARAHLQSAGKSQEGRKTSACEHFFQSDCISLMSWKVDWPWCSMRLSGLQLGGPRLLLGEPAVPGRRPAAWWEIPDCVQPHL